MATLGLTLGLAGFVVSPDATLALVVRTGNGNDSAPIEDQGWSHVGSIGNGSGVYMGNGWVLTARHVNRNTPFNLDGIDYSLTGQTVPIAPVAGDSGSPDLLLFRINNAPNLPLMPIRQTSITPGTAVTMIGTGSIVGSGEKSYSTGIGANALVGFDVSATRSKLWGENTVWRTYEQNIDDNRDLITLNNGDTLNDLFFNGLGYSSRTFTTHFNKETYDGESSRTHEAQAQGGDSGAGVFANNAGTWELSGLMVSIFGYRSNSAIYHGTGALTNDILGGRPAM
ncbi:MAG: trypsin-like peptidase domain-containing protein [Phycisphaerales bacterium]|nr:trypsin-like peptidase domain-containing protein [Phycisphaerales bacterium]